MGKWNKTAELRCPFCGSTRLNRSRCGFVERIFLRFLWLRPFRCVYCCKRFYRHHQPIDVPQHETPVIAARLRLFEDHHPSVRTEIPVNCGQVERRRFSRLRCQIPARVVVGSGSCITGIVSGISLNGCFIEVPDTVPVGREIELRLEVGAGARSLGLVRRSLQARGMGIEFILMAVPSFRRLQSFARESVSLHGGTESREVLAASQSEDGCDFSTTADLADVVVRVLCQKGFSLVTNGSR